MLIRTTYHGHTDTRGSRISASLMGSGTRHRLTVPFDHAALRPHDMAAAALAERIGVEGSWLLVGDHPGGYYYAAVDLDMLDSPTFVSGHAADDDPGTTPASDSGKLS